MSLNDFEIGGELGKGAFGSVYIVKRKKDKKIYAMKQVKMIGLNKKEKNNAFNEVRLLSSLSHKNIIGYKEAFYDNETETLNIVMEYADDGDLYSKIKENVKKHKYFEESVIWKTLIQILEGLKYLHKCCIIHRDLKSANIFLTKKGIIKIGDLNVSKIIKSMGMASTQTGTPYFASPEIWNNKPYDYKCDIWSAGCIIYEMARFHVPFRAGSMRELYNNIMRGIYPPIPLKYSHELKNIIKKILVINPELRPSANELLNCDIIKQKTKELNLINNDDNDIVKDFNNIPKCINNVNTIITKKKYEFEMKNNSKEILLNDENDNSKKNIYIPHNYNNENNIKGKKIFSSIMNDKNDIININYNIGNNNDSFIKKSFNKPKYKLNLKDDVQSEYNTNNFISNIFKKKKKNIFKINNITNLINNNIIIVNNNDSKNNNSKIENIKNKNNLNIPKKHSFINKNNSIPYYNPKNYNKIPKADNINNNKINLSKCNSIITDNNPNCDVDNSRQLNYYIISRNHSSAKLINDLSENTISKEENKIYYHKKLSGKRSLSLNNLKKKKNISLKINIPKNGRNLKKKHLKQNYSQNNIYTNSLLSIDKINNNISTINNENENSSKYEFNIYKDLKIHKKIFGQKNQNIITDRNDFNTLIYRNKFIQLKNMHSNEIRNRNKNIFNLYNNNFKNRTNDENKIKTEDTNFTIIKRQSSLKLLNELNNLSLNNKQHSYREKRKKIFFNNLDELLNKNEKNDNDIKEDKKLTFARRINSHRGNSFNSYINIKNKIFENNDYGNDIVLNSITLIHKNKNIQEINRTEFNNQKLKNNKFFGKHILPRPPNNINNKRKIIHYNSNYNLNSNINFKKNIMNSNYSGKNNNFHKIFYDKMRKKMNDITQRNYIKEYPQLVTTNEKIGYNIPDRTIIRRNNSEVSRHFSDINKKNFFSINKNSQKLLF